MKTLAVLLAFTFIGLGQVPPVIPTAPLNRVASLPVSCTVGKSPAVIYNASGIDGVYTAQGSPCAYALSPGGSTSVLTGDASGPAGSNTVSKINNVAVPTSATCLSTGSGAAPVSGCPNLPITTAVQGTASSNVLRDWPSTADSSLAAQITAIGSTPTTLLVPRSGATVSASATIPATITIQSQQGGILTVASGQTLTVQGSIQAGSYQIFAGAGLVSLSGNSTQSYCDAMWWGALGDGSTNDTAALQAAIHSCVSAGNGKMAFYFAPKTFRVCNLNLADLTTTNCPVNAQCSAPSKIYSNSANSYFAAHLQATSSCGTVSTDKVVTLNSVSETTIDGVYIDGLATSGTSGTGASCFDARWLATGYVSAPATHNTYQNLNLINCQDSSTGYGMLADKNEDSNFNNIIISGGSGRTGTAVGFRFDDNQGAIASVQNLTIYNGDPVQFNVQSVAVTGGFWSGGLIIGSSANANANNLITLNGTQIAHNSNSGVVVNTLKYSGSNVAAENLTCNGCFLAPEVLTSGQSIFSGSWLVGAVINGGQASTGTGSMFGTITSPLTGYPPVFHFLATDVSGTQPASSSSVIVDQNGQYNSAAGNLTYSTGVPFSFTGGITVSPTENLNGVGTGNASLYLEGGGGHKWLLQANGSVNSDVTALGWADISAGITPLSWNDTNMTGLAGWVYGWSSNASYANVSAPDTGLSRISAKVIAVGNGTAGDASGTIKSAIGQVGQLTGTGSAPTCAVNTTYAGSGATCSVSGTNLSHNVTLNTGTGTTAGGVLVTVTFNGTLATAPNGCSLTPQNTNAVGQAAMVYTTAPSTTAYTISVAGSAIPASISGYTWHVPCI